MKYCMKCGKKMQDDDAFCANCGFGGADNIDPFGYDTPNKDIPGVQADDQTSDVSEETETAQGENPAQPQPAPSTAKYNKSFAQSVKSVMTGNKRGLLSSILVLICSVVMLFVSIFAPVKVADYNLIMGETSMTIDSVSGGTLKVSYSEVEQSAFKVIGAFAYLNPTEKQKRAIEKQMDNAKEAAGTDFTLWMYTHQDANEFTVAKKQSEIYNKHMSDVNLYAYCLVQTDEEEYERIRLNMLMFLGVTALVVLMMFATAIASLVYTILCIVGLARRKPNINVNRFLKIMLGMTGAALLTCLLSPTTMPSGSPFGLFVFVAVCALAWGTVSALCDGQKPFAVLKRGLLAVLAFVIFILLCCNSVKFVAEQDYLYVVSVKPGMGMFGLASSVPDVTGMGLVLGIIYLLLGVCGGITAYVTLAGVLNSYDKQEDKSFTIGVRSVMLAVFVIAAIVISFSFEALAEAFNKILDATSSSSVYFEGEMSIRGTVWAAAVLSVLTAIAAFVLKVPNRPQDNSDTAQPIEATQPAEAEQSVDNAQPVESAEKAENV